MPHAGGQHLAVFIHDGQLAAGTEARVNAQRHFALDRRGHEQLVQVLSEHLNGSGSGPVGQFGPNLPFQTGLDQPFPRVLTGRLHLPGGRTAFPNEGPFQNTNGGSFVHPDAHLQEFLPFPPVNRQNPMPGKIAHLLRKIVVHAVYAVFVLGFFGFQYACAEGQLPQLLTNVRVVAELLGQNIPSALQRVFDGFNALVRLNKSLCDLLRRFFLFILHQKLQGQRFQSLFLGNGSAGAALGAEGTIQILQLRQSGGRRQLGGKLVRQVALLLQSGFDFTAAFVKAAKILKALKNFPKHLIVQRIRHFLAVAGDKRNRISVVDQLEHILTLLFFQMKFLTKNGGNVHWFKSFPFYMHKRL